MKAFRNKSPYIMGLCCFVGLLFANPVEEAAKVPPTSPSLVPKPDTSPVLPTTPVNHKRWTIMAIGGSVAKGWNDAPNEGYLKRAMSAVSNQLDLDIKFWNESIGGYTPEKLGGYFARLLKAYKPNIVIISWGMLDDIASKTPKDTFQTSIKQEVSLAVQLGASVWIVTPPVTEATYAVKDAVLEQVYAGYEIQAARSVTPGDIHVFDLMNSMKDYLVTNHQSVQMYASNAWHPNPAGHILAGELLASAIINRRVSLGL